MNFGNLQVEHEGTTTRSQSLDSEEFEENNRWQQQQQQVKVELLYEMNAGPTQRASAVRERIEKKGKKKGGEGQ